jgi:hypothetical protein
MWRWQRSVASFSRQTLGSPTGQDWPTAEHVQNQVVMGAAGGRTSSSPDCSALAVGSAASFKLRSICREQVESCYSNEVTDNSGSHPVRVLIQARNDSVTGLSVRRPKNGYSDLRATGGSSTASARATLANVISSIDRNRSGATSSLWSCLTVLTSATAWSRSISTIAFRIDSGTRAGSYAVRTTRSRLRRPMLFPNYD